MEGLWFIDESEKLDFIQGYMHVIASLLRPFTCDVAIWESYKQSIPASLTKATTKHPPSSPRKQMASPKSYTQAPLKFNQAPLTSFTHLAQPSYAPTDP